MRKHKNVIWCLVVLFTLVSIPFFVYALSADQIMLKFDQSAKFQKMRCDIVIELFKGNNKIATKKVRMANYVKNLGQPNEQEMSIAYFYAPAEEIGNSILTVEQPDQTEDLKYLYLIGLRKPKRITGSDLGSDFMGTDFSNEDMGRPKYHNYTYKLLGEENAVLKGKSYSCWVIECTPKTAALKSDYGISKKIRWVEKTTFLDLKAEIYDLSGNLNKKRNLMDIISAKNVNGQTVYQVVQMKAENVQRGTSTLVTFENIQYENQANVSPNIFTEQYLTQKWW